MSSCEAAGHCRSVIGVDESMCMIKSAGEVKTQPEKKRKGLESHTPTSSYPAAILQRVPYAVFIIFRRRPGRIVFGAWPKFTNIG